MINLLALLGIAPSSEEQKTEVKHTDSIMFDMYRLVNGEKPFSLVYVELVRKDGTVIGDPKYVCDLVGGKMIGKREIGVVVPLGTQDSIYSKLESLADAPFATELRISHAGYPGHSEKDRHIIGDLLVEVQTYKKRRTYAGKQPSPAIEARVLETA